MQKLEWYRIDIVTPPTSRPVLFYSLSGYIKPHDRTIISGYYDPEYRPLSPYLDDQSTCLSDSGLYPTHWAYLDDHIFPKELV